MKKVKVAILGAGDIANRMAVTLNGMKTVESYAIASRDLDRARLFAREYGFAKAYGSYKDLLEDNNVDLIYIAVPHSLHSKYCMMCIDAGKAVLCEKPFAANALQAKEVFDYAKAKDVFITEANWVWYMPMVKVIIDFCANNEIGQITSMSTTIGWPNSNSPRIKDPELAGGVLLDMGIYPITLSRIVFGDNIESIDSSVQMSSTGVDLQDTITFKYAGNRMATMFMTAYSPAERTAVLYGEKGYAIINDVNSYQSLTVFDENNRIIRKIEIPHKITGFEYEVQACVDALEANKLECDLLPHQRTIETLEICDKIRKIWGMKYPWE